MIQKIVFFCALLVTSFSKINSQQNDECKTKLSLFHHPVIAQKYNEAYEPWLYVFTECPDLNLAIYADGEKILKHKIKTTKGEVRLGFIETLLDLWEKRKIYFASTTPTGEYAAKACQLLYDYKDEVSNSKAELYNCFNNAFTTDKRMFRNPKSLYTYFFLTATLFDQGEKTASELFNSYDDVNEKIELEIQNYSEKLNELVLKTEKGETFTKREERNKNAYESYLKAYTLIKESVNVIADKKANCENLIPLYSKHFDVHQNDSIWLKRSVSRMYHKDCTEGELYEKLVKQYDKVAPSADTKIFVATLLFKKGKDKEAFQYIQEAYKLETRPYEKSNLGIRIGVILKNKGQYSKARAFLFEALKLNPSNGKPHLIIAQMYNSSARNKNCGKDNFYQRAVYWLAAKEARKASRIDPTLQKLTNQSVANYEAKAPTKKEIFQKGIAGKRIGIKCWINKSIVVPKLD